MSIIVHEGFVSGSPAGRQFLPVGSDKRMSSEPNPNLVRYPSPVAGKIRNTTIVVENPNPAAFTLRILVNGATVLSGPVAGSLPAETVLSIPGEGTVAEGAFIGVEADGVGVALPASVKLAVSYVLEEVLS